MNVCMHRANKEVHLKDMLGHLVMYKDEMYMVVNERTIADKAYVFLVHIETGVIKRGYKDGICEPITNEAVVKMMLSSEKGVLGHGNRNCEAYVLTAGDCFMDCNFDLYLKLSCDETSDICMVLEECGYRLQRNDDKAEHDNRGKNILALNMLTGELCCLSDTTLVYKLNAQLEIGKEEEEE